MPLSSNTITTITIAPVFFLFYLFLYLFHFFLSFIHCISQPFSFTIRSNIYVVLLVIVFFVSERFSSYFTCTYQPCAVLCYHSLIVCNFYCNISLHFFLFLTLMLHSVSMTTDCLRFHSYNVSAFSFSSHEAAWNGSKLFFSKLSGDISAKRGKIFLQSFFLLREKEKKRKWKVHIAEQQINNITL